MDRNIVCSVACAILLVSFTFFCPEFILEPFQTYEVAKGNAYIIIILSARENFERRLFLREFWVSLLQNHDIDYYFIVGDKSCPYPMADRKDPFSCQFWNVSANLKLNQSISSSMILNSSEMYTINQGFDFKLYFTCNVNMLADWCVVKMLHRAKSIRVLPLSNMPSNAIEDIIVRELAQLHLQFGNERILVEGGLFQIAPGISSWDQSSPFMSILQIDIADFENHVNTQNERLSNWKNHLELVSQKLSEESAKFKDILFVDLIDTYRNLPQKILKSFSWISDNKDFAYLLKTDDDCMINFPLGLELLEEVLQQDTSSKIWFGSFRKLWRVDIAGKWAERQYRSLVYPPFACGSGSILSWKLVQWISNNSEILHSYQGEDTSLGIWLSAIRPNFIHNDLWSCDETCEFESISRSQMSVEDMKSSWKMFQQCGSICECS
ncbi:UDP-GalNAc:beta-1,3-N-acetylgalactosaminyltransferase 2 [Nymphon striatum]|nr:UDP-GalNAc:beta-1,3-N-acetylgalactosaminyltransferase 2 [Nymphon striatum]